LIDNKLNKIYNHFGEKHQFDKLYEECKEYIEAYEHKSELDMLDEAGDLYVVSRQLYMHNDVVYDTVGYKTDRTLERIEDCYYESI